MGKEFRAEVRKVLYPKSRKTEDAKQIVLKKTLLRILLIVTTYFLRTS